jgi:hypothetical protein
MNDFSSVSAITKTEQLRVPHRACGYADMVTRKASCMRGVSQRRRTRRPAYACVQLSLTLSHAWAQPCHLSAGAPLTRHWRRTNRCSPSSPEDPRFYVITVHSSEAVRLHTCYCCRRSSTLPSRPLPFSLPLATPTSLSLHKHPQDKQTPRPGTVAPENAWTMQQ